MGRAITDDVYGCIIGGAIGDALGAPVEGWTRDRIEEEYGTLETFKQYYMPYSNTRPGVVTSDTTMRQYLCLTIIETEGRVTPPDFAEVLRDHLNPDRVWINEEIIVQKLSAGVDPWSAGEGAIPDNKATSAITPIGVVNAGDPAQAYQDGFAIASMFQDGPHRHSTATVAAGVAEAVTPEASVESVLDTMVERSTGVVTRAIDLAIDLGRRSATVDELVEALYDRFLDWRWPAVRWDCETYREGGVFSASTLETVPVAMAIFDACDGDVNRSIVEGANYGRDSDAVATIAGSLAGALDGASEIREDWKEQCEEANRDLFDELEGDPDADFRFTAERLVGALETERTRASERVEALDRILDGGET